MKKLCSMSCSISLFLMIAIARCVIGVGASSAEEPKGTTQSPSSVQSGDQRLHTFLSKVSGLLRRPDLALTARFQANTLRAERPRLPASATRDVTIVSCGDEAASFGAVCGYVPVPLDWKHPGRMGKINIYFELYRGATEPVESAILVNFGGPGITTTGLRSSVFWIFGPSLDKHDLLLIDDRGRGLSSAMDCSDLQHGTASWAQAVAVCASQLGDAASRYGTGDVAMDTDAVRAALGYDKVDYYGGSYGGADVSAYATRFGEHLRSVILDAPFAAPSFNVFRYAKSRISANSRMVNLTCLRSPACSADHANPPVELNALVWTIRLHPVEGDSYDASGNPVHVRIDEAALLNYLIDNPYGIRTNTAELLAATASLWRGDPKPLLRLGAEGYFPMEREFGDASWSSVGIYVGTSAVDGPEPWDWSAPASVRERQYAHAVSALPPLFFSPFSREAATDVMFSFNQNSGKYLLWWEVPTPPSPIEPPHAKYPNVPTLALSGDLDNIVPFEEASRVIALFHSAPIVVAGAGHETVWYSQCVRDLISGFIDTLEIGDTSCLRTPEIITPAVGRFPLLARDARPAEVDPDGQNEVGTAERKVVTVAVAAAADVLPRSIIGSGSGVGLRGGTFTVTDPDIWQITLTDCAFAQDVKVSGKISWPADNSVVADLTVTGPGTAGGTLHIDGAWYVPGPIGKFKVTGTLGGKKVAVLVPEG
jgi:pimeloyl-ACP methyl ester carboxylesterase